MKYRKKPVEIEAEQINTLEVDELLRIRDWCGGVLIGDPDKEAGPVLEIHTLEGTMFANENDYIIKGVKGEFYPCKPDIFAETYEPVESLGGEESQPELEYLGIVDWENNDPHQIPRIKVTSSPPKFKDMDALYVIKQPSSSVTKEENGDEA